MVAPLGSANRAPVEARLKPDALADQLADERNAVSELRLLLADAAELHRSRFLAGEPIESLVHGRCDTIDHIIVAVWRRFGARLGGTTDLVAVGGYGRGELHPHSDIDLLLLIADALPARADEAIGRFLSFLWDIGLEVGHSVRTLSECEVEAAKDVTVLTTLLEARLLDGPGALFAELPDYISVGKTMSSADFFKAKTEEQLERHHRYHDTAYNLEPNVKGSPGGLRDIQMITWIARRHLGAADLDQLVEHGFLTEGQLRILLSGRAFLWRVRFGLHLLTGRREDRLLFDHQIKLAKMLGYEDATFTLAVEQLMQRYYRTVMELSRLNEMLLQLFEEDILLDRNAPATPLGEHFLARNGYLEARDEQVFQSDPSALLELFLLLEQNLDLRGVSARAIALVKQNLWLIDEEFRQNPRHHRLFLEILKAPQGVTRTLKRMNTYGVLGLYIPAFGRIVGRMQYDLFHAYTVDQHTLFVVENLRRLALPRFDDHLPHVSAVMQTLEKPEIVYLAGLFHDIAKGRGGDHSELGAIDAESFCLEHGMSRYDARLVAWLVRHHLLLSMTAQKKDVNDPNVVNAFAEEVGDERHLDHLYVLTICDVRATNPKIWNSWKDTLFWELYQGTKRALRRGAANPIDQEELILETKAQAEKLLVERGVKPERWQDLWSEFSDEYYLRHRAEEIAWHTSMLIDDGATQSPLVAATNTIADGLTVLSVYADRKRQSYMRTTAILDDLGLNVVDARIVPVSADRTLNTYCVLDSVGQPVADGEPLEELIARVRRALDSADGKPIRVTRRVPRRVRVFSTPVEISISQDPANQRTVIELVAGDRPGLLFQVGRVFDAHAVALQNAKVATIGERAEDVFFVTTEDNRPLDDASADKVRAALIEALSDNATND